VKLNPCRRRASGLYCCRSSRCGALRDPCVPWGPSGEAPRGIAPQVRSAYPHRRGTCFTYGLASLERLEEPAVLLGRRGECALIGAFLDRPADDTALLLRGEPGAGKTVLLDAAADAASAAKAWVRRGGPAPDRLLVPTRQEGPELRHMACEASSAPCSTGSRRGYPQPAAAYTAAGRTGRHIPTICGWEVHDESACAGPR